MKHLLGIFVIVIVLLVVAGGKETAAASKQTLTGQDAINFLQETGIYYQLTPEANGGDSPVGREFFLTGLVGSSDGATDDYFGISVARDGNTILIGVNQADVDGDFDPGAAYVFTGSGGAWHQQTKLTARDGAEYDEFGGAVALDGNTALIGAHKVDGTGSDNVGKAYFFQRQPFENFLPLVVH